MATVQSPYLSLKTPSTNKYANGIDLALAGSWIAHISMDQYSGTFELVDTITRPTYDGGIVGLQTAGTHAAFKLVTPSTSATAAVLSSFTLIYNDGELQ